MTEIPLATWTRTNAEAVIAIERYKEGGFCDRFAYLVDLADRHDADLAAVIDLADLLGPDEDFDGLVTSIEDGAEGYGFGVCAFVGEA